MVAGGKITLREAQTIAYLLDHGRWPDPETAEWFESRASRQALDFLLVARLRGVVATQVRGRDGPRPVDSPPKE